MDIFLLLPVVLVVIALTAPRYGVDSRDGHDWRPRSGPPAPPLPMASRRRSTPVADLVALGRWLRTGARVSARLAGRGATLVVGAVRRA